MPIGEAWQTLLETPLINLMVALSVLCFGSYGLAILLFTVISRAILFPLTLRMLHSMRALQDLAPRQQEIQKKYSDPRRRNEEMMKLYKEAGVNPLGCLGPQLIQFPIFIALYQVIRNTLGTTPEGVLNLSRRLYDVDFIQDAIPLSRTFLGMDLGRNGNIVLGLLVFAAMWLQQRISTSRAQAAINPQQAAMNKQMQIMLPIVFSSFVLFSPAGLGVYWFASTAIGIILQWIFVGPGDFTWGSLLPGSLRTRLGIALPEPGTGRGSHRRPTQQNDASEGGDTESRSTDASSGDERQNGRRSGRQGPRTTRPSSRSGRRRRHHGG